MAEIALFPIPGMVSLPFSTVPLHIFEPRYRKLIKDSLELERPIAVCHTKRVIHAAKPEQSMEEVLHNNQAVYEPVDVFSAGHCRLVETMVDGRMIVEIDMERRYRRRADVQVLPYRVAECEDYPDEVVMDENPRQLEQLREHIDHSLLRLAEGHGKSIKELIGGERWRNLSDEEYSFKVFQTVKFDPELMQMLLEIRTVHQRLLFLAQALRAGPVQ